MSEIDDLEETLRNAGRVPKKHRFVRVRDASKRALIAASKRGAVKSTGRRKPPPVSLANIWKGKPE